jgi:hypothetical protein
MFHLFHLDVACLISMMHMLQWLYTYVASVCSKYFTCFRRMLQVFYLDVTYVTNIYFNCFSMLQQVLPPTRSNSRARSRCTRHLRTTRRGPHGGACSRLNICACTLCSLPLSLALGHARCALSRFGYACCDPSFSHADTARVSRIGAYALCSLSYRGTRCVSSLTCSWADPCTCSPRQTQQQKETWGATTAAGGDACSKKKA